MFQIPVAVTAEKIAEGDHVIDGRPAMSVERNGVAGSDPEIDDPDAVILENYGVMLRCRDRSVERQRGFVCYIVFFHMFLFSLS